MTFEELLGSSLSTSRNRPSHTFQGSFTSPITMPVMHMVKWLFRGCLCTCRLIRLMSRTIVFCSQDNHAKPSVVIAPLPQKLSLASIVKAGTTSIKSDKVRESKCSGKKNPHYSVITPATYCRSFIDKPRLPRELSSRLYTAFFPPAYSYARMKSAEIVSVLKRDWFVDDFTDDESDIGVEDAESDGGGR